MQTKYSIGADVMNTSELLQLYEREIFKEKTYILRGEISVEHLSGSYKWESPWMSRSE